MVVPRSMVSLRFMKNKTIDNPLFKKQLGRFIKVQKLNLEDLQIYNDKVAKTISENI